MTREEAINLVKQVLPCLNVDEKIREGFKTLIPELRESEDERIRKTLIEALKTSKTVGELKFIFPESTREECIAYLEKQGEQKVSVDDFKAKDWYVSKVDGKIHNIYYSVDKVKPKFKVGDKIIEKDFDKCGRGTIIDIKDGKYIFNDGGFICIEEQGLWKLVEQKPAWSEEDERIRKALINYFKAHNALVGENWNGIECDNVIAYLEKQKEQKPAVEQLDGTFNSYDMAKTFVEGQYYVMEHPGRFGLCKPVEWSEDIIQRAIKEVGLTQHQIDWFKTNVFPPKQEWSDEDEHIYNKALDALYYRDCNEKDDVIFALKDLCDLISRKRKRIPLYARWKPSEEDLMMLEHIIGQYEIGNKNCKTMGYLPRVEELNFLKKILDVWKN